MSTALRFPLPAVLVLAEHAVAATEHEQSFSEQLHGTDPAPALVWVKDWGTYLMSNGLPGLPPDGTTNCVYAIGWGPDTGPELAQTSVGGDDFAEHLKLRDPADDVPLIDRMRHAARIGRSWLVLLVTPTTVEIGFARER